MPAGVELAASQHLHTLARQGYGMTEATTMISGPMGLGRPGEPGTVGWLAAGTQARLVDPDSGQDVPPGQPGELWVRGPQVMAGYFDDPDATAATITADGWLRTGDLVRVRDAAVVGRPHPHAGEVPVAYVVLAGPATPDELIAFAAPRLAAHKRLHDVRIVDQLPRMPTGKLLRRPIRDHERHAAEEPSIQVT